MARTSGSRTSETGGKVLPKFLNDVSRKNNCLSPKISDDLFYLLVTDHFNVSLWYFSVGGPNRYSRHRYVGGPKSLHFDKITRDVNPCPCRLLKDFFQVLVLVLVLGG